MKKRTFRHILLLLAVIIVGTLLAFSIAYSPNIDGIFNMPLVPSETLYIITALAILLPVLLVLLILVVLTRRKINYQNGFDDSGVPENFKTEEAYSSEKVNEQGNKDDEGEETPSVSRFFMLTKTDKEYESKPATEFDNGITLEKLCEKFRAFSASRLGLYYDIKDIRRFIAGLATSKILVMQGMSGTGKTSLAYAFGEFLGNRSTIVPIQPMWKERTDLIGYYNEFTKKFNETALLQKLYEANLSDEMYITVLDEMNIARVEYYFAEFLSLLEIPDPDGRYLDVVSDKWENDPKQLKDGRVRLPDNMWFIGTINNDDSTFAISDKVYDRAMVMNLDKKARTFEAEDTEGVKLSAKKFNALVERAKREYEITERNMKRINELDRYMINTFKITFGNRIMKQMREYVAVYIACGGEETDAIDDIMSKKVFRKLESKNPVYVRNSCQGLREYLDKLFGQDKMTECRQYVDQLEKNS
ncbi:MAG: AAA family ATPase [Christensenellaceae bacterium]